MENWKNQTELGKPFGKSARAVGKFLYERGLRDEDGEPTKDAWDEDLVKGFVMKNGTTCYKWDVDKLKPLLEERYGVLETPENRLERINTQLAIVESNIAHNRLEGFSEQFKDQLLKEKAELSAK